jgi:5'-nucleotidase
MSSLLRLDVLVQITQTFAGRLASLGRQCGPALLGLTLAACAWVTPAPSGPVAVKLLAINDFHGNLKPPSSGIRIKDPKDPTKTVTVEAGGAEAMATLVKDLRAKNPNNIFVAAGDLIGGSPLLSALFHDEPTVESLGLMGLEVTAVGNHEFDQGKDELLRKQHGGCHPTDGCKGPAAFKGASFKYLAASTVDLRTGKTIFPPYHVKRFEGIPVAFIGLTLKNTPAIVAPSGVVGLQFNDEADTVNALLPELKKQGIEAIVLLIHEGGFPTGDYNECPGISGPIVDIVKKLDKAVDLVVSGHTHRAYNCVIDGRLVTSGDKYGTIVTEIDVTIDPKTRDVAKAQANNLIVYRDRYAKDPAQTQLIEAYEKLAAPLADRPVATLSDTLNRDENPAGETTLGQWVADAQLAATQAPENGGAVIAVSNIGGIRAPLAKTGDGRVRYADVFAVQPFYNNLVTLSLTGAQLQLALEQQWINQPKPRPLQVSKGFSYTWDASRPVGQRVVPGSLKLNGQPLQPQQTYRVTVNSFLADGGDGFAVFKQGTQRRTGAMDVDALEQFMRAQRIVGPGKLDRIQRLN